MESFKDFVGSNAKREIVAVQGLGFVGFATALVLATCASKDYAILGIEAQTKDGRKKASLFDKGLLEIESSDESFKASYSEALQQKKLFGTSDPTTFGFAKIIVISVNLDVDLSNIKEDASLSPKHSSDVKYSVSLDAFKKAIRTVGQHCDPNALVLLETTVPPGTTELVVWPILKEELEKRGLDWNGLALGYSYERVTPGKNYLGSIVNSHRVYAGVNRQSSIRVRTFLETFINTDKYFVDELSNTTAAEMAKVLENSYRATNIAFAVEWSRFAEATGVNLYDVVDVIRRRPTHANLMYPGIGVGGYCLTKDSYLADHSAREFFQLDGLPMSSFALSVNRRMPEYCAEFIVSEAKRLNIAIKALGILGVSYGPNIGDTRYSPVFDFANLMSSFGTTLSFHDPFIEHWDELNVSVASDIAKFLNADTSVFAICTKHDFYSSADFLSELENCTKQILIFDCVGSLQKIKLPTNVAVLTLGSGD